LRLYKGIWDKECVQKEEWIEQIYSRGKKKWEVTEWQIGDTVYLSGYRSIAACDYRMR
jgi:hypothetical protein